MHRRASRSWTAGAIALAALATAATPARAADSPQISGGRAVAGTPQVGEPLTTTAAVSGARPLKVTYTWQRCGSMAMASCTDIPGARKPSYTARAADQGAFLRSTVRAENAQGWAWVTSAPTAAIAASAAPAPTVPPSTGGATSDAPWLDPFPLVRIRGWLTPAGARVQALTVNAPAGATIGVACAGRGCPRSSWARTAVLVHLRPFEVVLAAGTRLNITVTRAGFVGKSTVITIRRGAAPARVDRCLYPGSSTPKACRAT